MSFAIVIPFTATLSFGTSGPWAYAIGRSQLDHLGKMDTRSGSSVLSGGIALITSSSLVSDIFVICSTHINNTTMRIALTYR